MKCGMLNIAQNTHLSASFGLLVQVYDELVFESADIENDMEQVEQEMIWAAKLDVPLVVDCKTGLNWAECH